MSNTSQRAKKQREQAEAAAFAFAQLVALRRAEPVSRDKPVHCDCLNWCGDDPWLDDGRARKCADYDRLHPPFFHCPRCGRDSYHPKDIAEGYCAHCHEFTRDDH